MRTALGLRPFSIRIGRPSRSSLSRTLPRARRSSKAFTVVMCVYMPQPSPHSHATAASAARSAGGRSGPAVGRGGRSEEHTSELQSRLHLVCRLLLEKKKKKKQRI